MKILVYDVAAEDGGGLVVLKQFHREAMENGRADIQWIFMTSADVLPEAPHIRVLCYEKIKKSWAHRLAFEYLELPGIIRKLDPDLVISLQNMPIKRCNIRQFVYLHQSLQYCPKRFSFFKKEERGLAIRQHIICGLIKNAMPKAEHIFVQTQWIKDATMKWLGRRSDEISVVPVCVDADSIPVRNYCAKEANSFFYPARAEMYKNHKVVISACEKLVSQGITDFRVLFTVKPEDGVYAARLFDMARNIPIEFIGTVPYERIWDYYSSTILLFPSYLETCGLPMLEAKAVGGRILASDMPFSHEALDGYPNADFFCYDDANQLAEKMKELLAGKAYIEVDSSSHAETVSLLESMLNEAKRKDRE